MLEGEAHNENVHISKSYIKMDDTYMNLTTSKNIKIVNHTPYPAEFEWKTFFSEKEENDKKT